MKTLEVIRVEESRSELTDRLRRESRWEEASEYRHERRLRAREAGLTRKDALEQSWKEMATAFPADTAPDKILDESIIWWCMRDISLVEDSTEELDRCWQVICAAIAIMLATRATLAYERLLNQMISDLAEEPFGSETRLQIVEVVPRPLRSLKKAAKQFGKEIDSGQYEVCCVERLRRLLSTIDRMNEANYLELARTELVE